MPAGTCDPASRGDAFNAGTLAGGINGEVSIDYRYGWDGVSVRPDCVGPLVNGTGPTTNRWAIRYVNGGQVTYYVHTLGKRGQPRRLTLAPGDSGTFTAAQASTNGYDTNEDLSSLYLSTDPNPPAAAATNR